jgi:arylsulfatase A-like enzyme
MKATALLLSVLLSAFAIQHASFATAAAPPNVVFILADDLGWGDLSCHGHSFIKTPNIDRLAREGTDFHHFNTASPVCSTSRVGFMTGQFPARFGVRTSISAISQNIKDRNVDWLDPRAPMLPRLLQGAGYVTGHYGKWHLTTAQAREAPLPAAYGVDEFAFHGRAHPTIERVIDYHDDCDEAVKFVRRHRAQPFFLNVWIHQSHLEHKPTPAALAANQQLDERQRIYAGVATDADLGVGKVLAALQELGLEQNTIVVFSSDNGPENTSQVQEMRGGFGGLYSIGETGGKKGRKRSLHEGGVCTPFIVRWPGHVPAGRVDKVTNLSATDLLPTVCAAIGASLPAGYQPDGENMLAAWKGTEVKRTKPIFWDWTGTTRPAECWPRWAVRDGDWKLLTDNARRRELYHLSADPGEKTDVANANPDVVQKLSALLDAWKAELPPEPPPEFIANSRKTAAQANH